MKLNGCSHSLYYEIGMNVILMLSHFLAPDEETGEWKHS